MCFRRMGWKIFHIGRKNRAFYECFFRYLNGTNFQPYEQHFTQAFESSPAIVGNKEVTGQGSDLAYAESQRQNSKLTVHDNVM